MMGDGITRATIEFERRAQDAKWGGAEHDDHHTGREWKALIAEHASRGDMVAVAALGFAIADALDRAVYRHDYSTRSPAVYPDLDFEEWGPAFSDPGDIS